MFCAGVDGILCAPDIIRGMIYSHDIVSVHCILIEEDRIDIQGFIAL